MIHVRYTLATLLSTIALPATAQQATMLRDQQTSGVGSVQFMA
ncbi:hypothetical protein SAMN05192583_2865 [Sphingomonas gellani]|uniref:Uncharacterized protein n=1 Tax=Sphingomonas gellani TaxID=1166340 RepID=A0A1H8GR56_9SPHN|nr:hypothetical protein [Sphingomonas gellani]SEN46473.1 hypothetical protein SAMN05192583_2865 [Sphingomonas gellani]